MRICRNCKGSGWFGESDTDVCQVCDGAGETLRYVRWPKYDKRTNNGDDSSSDCWFDQGAGKFVQADVGVNLNDSANSA